ncbi:LacI family DNA-binding transcriptional regulator [Methylobacterium brachythecii]|uniref:Transcriptional regulator n=1 Tax=Methylobacterium brachythecii TaxID=1176177 RepID=A0A7W6AI05_9HYPH|nr:LacI family DNA-binding transcriptional regulator [Methylobacterium brachythecii]MBB3903713.1 LacI family transcriptional regulator [Methylobacterium brachythecii]GLS44282.1 transcriptional regulator [Methylobacterium brachythecii]
MTKPQISQEISQDPLRFPVTKDVAERAGVSTATVSRVLNGTARVRADKHEAVMKAAEELGFVANGAARALSMRRFMAVGAVVPNIENEAFIRVLSSFQDRLRQEGYTLIAANSGYDIDNVLREATFLIERGIDGLMLVGDIHHPLLHARIARQKIPMVQVFTLSTERACIGFDNAASAGRAASYLLDLGHTRIGVISGLRKDNDRGGARVEGIHAALAARGLRMLPEHDVEISYGIGGGRDGFRQMLASGAEPPTAIICGTDQIAFGAMIEARSRGLDIPGDLSVIGHNDSDFAAFLSPPLTTINVHSAAIGRAAGDHLVSRMAGRPTVRLTEIDAELIVRGSTAPPRARG